MRRRVGPQRGAEPWSALAGGFSVLGGVGHAEVPAVAVCPGVTLARGRITWRRYGLPKFWTPNQMRVGGEGRAAAPRPPPQRSLAVNHIFPLRFSAKSLGSARAFRYVAGSEQNNFSSLKITASTYYICRVGCSGVACSLGFRLSVWTRALTGIVHRFLRQNPRVDTKEVTAVLIY